MFYLAAVLSYSILGAAFIGLMKYQKVLPSYRPFLWFLWIAVANELISSLVIYFFRNNVITANVYVLAEAFLLLRMFKAWTIDPVVLRRFDGLMLALTIAWIADNLILHSVSRFNAGFRILYSTILVFVAIEQINQVIIFERNSIIKNPRFLISASILIFYTYKSLLEVFYLFHINSSKTFNNSLFLVLVLFNLLSNIIYALATLCLPSKQKLSLPY